MREMWARMQYDRWSEEAVREKGEEQKVDKENDVKEVDCAKEVDLKGPQKKENQNSVIENRTKEEMVMKSVM